MILKCLNCKNKFQSTSNKRKYCSRKCYALSKKGKEPTHLKLNRGTRPKNQVKKICKVCGKQFEVHKCRENTAHYCSNQCYHKRNPALGYHCNMCGKLFYDWDRNRRFCSHKCYSKFKKITGLGNNKNIGKWVKINGKPQKAFKWDKGDKHPNWRGGITHQNDIIRKSKKYKEWVKRVFKRDNFTCVNCGTKGGILNADHILPFAYFKDKRFDIDNGRTLCKECHSILPNGRELKIMFELEKITAKDYIEIANKRLKLYLNQTDVRSWCTDE